MLQNRERIMKKCLILVQAGAMLALGSGCVVVPGHHHRTVVHHPPVPRPVVVAPRHTPPPIVVRPKPVIPPPPVVVVEAPRPVPPPVIVVEQPRPRHTPPGHLVKARQPATTVHVTINPRERAIIKEYVIHTKSKHGRAHGVDHPGQGKGRNKGLPPGIAKKVDRGNDLPPDWQSRCVKGQVMPTEIYKRCEPLPYDVVVKLPPPPTGTIIVTIEGKALRLMQATLEILDVFDVI